METLRTEQSKTGGKRHKEKSSANEYRKRIQQVAYNNISLVLYKVVGWEEPAISISYHKFNKQIANTHATIHLLLNSCQKLFALPSLRLAVLFGCAQFITCARNHTYTTKCRINGRQIHRLFSVKLLCRLSLVEYTCTYE